MIGWLREAGNSSRNSGSASSGALFVSGAGAGITGRTCTAVAHGILGRFLMLQPPNTPAAQQRKTKAMFTFEGRLAFLLLL
jgi:hypothetical protein